MIDAQFISELDHIVGWPGSVSFNIVNAQLYMHIDKLVGDTHELIGGIYFSIPTIENAIDPRDIIRDELIAFLAG